MNLRHTVLSFALTMSLSTAAQAALSLRVGDVTVAPGSISFLPVYIHSDIGESINIANAEFKITATNSQGRFEFVNWDDAASDPTFTASNYLFAGNSLDQDADISWGASGQSPFDTFLGGDSSLDQQDVLLTSADKLLALLPIKASAGATPNAGDTFSVSLVSSGAMDASNNSNFEDSSNAFHTFSSTPGTITAVPEPSSSILAIAAIALTLACNCFRRSRCSCGSFLSASK